MLILLKTNLLKEMKIIFTMGIFIKKPGQELMSDHRINLMAFQTMICLEYLSKAIMFSFFADITRPWGVWIFIVLTLLVVFFLVYTNNNEDED
jgi:hypothetical protein